MYQWSIVTRINFITSFAGGLWTFVWFNPVHASLRLFQLRWLLVLPLMLVETQVMAAGWFSGEWWIESLQYFRSAPKKLILLDHRFLTQTASIVIRHATVFRGRLRHRSGYLRLLQDLSFTFEFSEAVRGFDLSTIQVSRCVFDSYLPCLVTIWCTASNQASQMSLKNDGSPADGPAGEAIPVQVFFQIQIHRLCNLDLLFRSQSLEPRYIQVLDLIEVSKDRKWAGAVSGYTMCIQAHPHDSWVFLG